MEYLMTLNWLAVVAATVATFLGGWIWYGPLFGKPWRKMMGMGAEPDMSGMMPAMMQGVANTFMANTVMAILLAMVVPASLTAALMLGLVCWVGFTLYSELGGVIWGNGNYPFKLMMINAGHGLMVALLGITVLIYLS